MNRFAKETMSFANYVRLRNPQLFEAIVGDLGIDLSDPGTRDAFVAQLQQSGADLEKVVANVQANPNAKPDKAKMVADQEFQKQQNMLNGKTVPKGINKKDWERVVGLMTPTGKPIPNQIGKGKGVDVAGVLEKGAKQGAVPANIDKLTPPWLKMNKVTPPVASKTPTVDPKHPMTPSEVAASKAKPNQVMGGGA
jgi:hypothetical protein